MIPECIWAVRGVPEGERATFFSVEEVEKVFLPERIRDRILDKIRNHFRDYPGALTLVGMTKEQECAAVEWELRPNRLRLSGGDGGPGAGVDEGHEDREVLFSWLKLPGVIE